MKGRAIVRARASIRRSAQSVFGGRPRCRARSRTDGPGARPRGVSTIEWRPGGLGVGHRCMRRPVSVERITRVDMALPGGAVCAAPAGPVEDLPSTTARRSSFAEPMRSRIPHLGGSQDHGGSCPPAAIVHVDRQHGVQARPDRRRTTCPAGMGVGGSGRDRSNGDHDVARSRGAARPSGFDSSESPDRVATDPLTVGLGRRGQAASARALQPAGPKYGRSVANRSSVAARR